MSGQIGNGKSKVSIDVVRNPTGNGKPAIMQEKIFEILLDGLAHRTEELLRCIGDDAEPHQLYSTIQDLRRKVRPKGLEIVNTTRHRQSYYMLVRQLHSDE